MSRSRALLDISTIITRSIVKRSKIAVTKKIASTALPAVPKRRKNVIRSSSPKEGKNVIRSSSPKEGKNDRSFRIRNDRISRRLAGQWPARIPLLIRPGPNCARRATIFVPLYKAANSPRHQPRPRDLRSIDRTRSCCPSPDARPCRASAVPPNAPPPRV